MILVVVADDIDFTDRHSALLRRLVAQHEVLYCTVGDVTMTDPALAGRDLLVVGAGAHVPDFYRRNAALHDDLVATARRRADVTRVPLGQLGVAATRLSGESGVVPAMADLLERHRRGREVGDGARRRPRSCPPTTTCFRHSPTAACGSALGIVAGLLGIALVAWMLHAPPDADRQGAAPTRWPPEGSTSPRSTTVQQRFAARQIDERQLHHELSTHCPPSSQPSTARRAPLAMTASDLEAVGLDDVCRGGRRLSTTAVHADAEVRSGGVGGGRRQLVDGDGRTCRGIGTMLMLQPWVGLVSAAAAIAVAVAVLLTLAAATGRLPGE